MSEGVVSVALPGAWITPQAATPGRLLLVDPGAALALLRSWLRRLATEPRRFGALDEYVRRRGAQVVARTDPAVQRGPQTSRGLEPLWTLCLAYRICAALREKSHTGDPPVAMDEPAPLPVVDDPIGGPCKRPEHTTARSPGSRSTHYVTPSDSLPSRSAFDQSTLAGPQNVRDRETLRTPDGLAADRSAHPHPGRTQARETRPRWRSGLRPAAVATLNLRHSTAPSGHL
jgi:hypothetical protein